MNLKERVYSVLTVSSTEKMNTVLSSLLTESHFHPVRMASSVSAARRAWNEQEYDLVIINSPLVDETGIRFAIDLSTSRGTVVLLLVRAETYEEMLDKVSPHGIFVLSKPTTSSILAVALGWMGSARERLRKLEKKTLSVEEKMEEIRLVNRAKWLLISELSMDEPQAHRYIEKQAMDRCISRRDVAQEIIQTYA